VYRGTRAEGRRAWNWDESGIDFLMKGRYDRNLEAVDEADVGDASFE
jgi:hypothetical protein